MEGAKLIGEQRKKDKFLMGRVKKMTNTAQEYIQQCRLFLQVQNLSDIFNAAGNQVEKEYLKGKICRESNIDWPNQACPAPRAWKIWKGFVATFCHDGTGRLLQANYMGKWTKTHQQWKWTGQGDMVTDLLGRTYKATGRGRRPTATRTDCTVHGTQYPAGVTRAAGQVKIHHIS